MIDHVLQSCSSILCVAELFHNVFHWIADLFNSHDTCSTYRMSDDYDSKFSEQPTYRKSGPSSQAHALRNFLSP